MSQKMPDCWQIVCYFILPLVASVGRSNWLFVKVSPQLLSHKTESHRKELWAVHILSLHIPVKPSDYLTAPTFHLVTYPNVLTKKSQDNELHFTSWQFFSYMAMLKKKHWSAVISHLITVYCVFLSFSLFILHATKTTAMFWRTHMICQLIRMNHANSKSLVCTSINEAISRARAVQAVRPFLRLILSSASCSTGIWLQL